MGIAPYEPKKARRRAVGRHPQMPPGHVSFSEPRWICLRQIVRLRRTGRSMSAPTAGTTGPVAHTVCSYREATSYLLLLTSYLVRAGDVGRQIADATGGIAFPLGGRWHRASPASPMTDEGASVRETLAGRLPALQAGLLPVACCPLPVACCPLPVARCPLRKPLAFLPLSSYNMLESLRKRRFCTWKHVMTL